MTKENFKRIRTQAQERFKKYTTLDNLFYISELLLLESQKYEYKNDMEIAIRLRKHSLDLDHIIDLIVKLMESEEQ